MQAARERGQGVLLRAICSVCVGDQGARPADLRQARHVAPCADVSPGRHEYQGDELRGTRRGSARPAMSAAGIAMVKVTCGRRCSIAAMHPE